MRFWESIKHLLYNMIVKEFYPATNSIDEYLDKLDSIFGTIAECESGRSIDELLDGPVCHSGFKRLN